MERPASPPRRIVLATRNPGKVREIRQVLAGLPVEVTCLEEFPNLEEPREDGATFAANARAKALYYARHTACWCLADDSGLVVDALNGGPGVHSARYAADRFAPGADRPARDAANTAKLLEALQGVPDECRQARFVCHVALAGPQGVVLEACGTLEGRIIREPRGDNGFGYDPVFLVGPTGRTVAELPAEEKNAISHRGHALREFARMLTDWLGQPA